MLTPEDAFKELTRRSGKILREHGFKGSGQNFRRDRGEIWQVFNFERERRPVLPLVRVKFTANLGLFFTNIKVPERDSLRQFESIRKVSFWNCDFQIRLGSLLRVDRALWMHVDRKNLDDVWQLLDGMIRTVIVPVFDLASDRNGFSQLSHKFPSHVYDESRLFLGDLAPPRKVLTSDEKRLAVETELDRVVSALRVAGYNPVLTRSNPQS